uniref:DUF4381 domain-containing protein n=1 Tax=Malonomonas rubra TaxID=57040 RepID=UPI0026F0EBB1
MKTTSPLAGLHDLHLPEPISCWPPAPGWWMLLALLLLLLIGLLFIIRQRKKTLLKRMTFEELNRLREEYRQTADSLQTIKQLSILLRRFCISYQPRSEAAALTGESWLRHLDRLGSCQDFTSGVGRPLAFGPYQQQPAANMIPLIDLCENWLK